MSGGVNGKGSKYRPVKKSVYDENFDKINWGSSKQKDEERGDAGCRTQS